MALVYESVNKITGLYPYNPADLKAKARYLDLIHKASTPLLHSLSSMNHCDYDEAKSQATEAIQILES